MLSIGEWLKDLSENYSVEKFEDIESGVFVAKVKEDIYLMNHSEVKECPQK